MLRKPTSREYLKRQYYFIIKKLRIAIITINLQARNNENSTD